MLLLCFCRGSMNVLRIVQELTIQSNNIIYSNLSHLKELSQDFVVPVPSLLERLEVVLVHEERFVVGISFRHTHDALQLAHHLQAACPAAR